MEQKELIIIGAGPAGLKAGLDAGRQGIDYMILEKGEVAGAWREIRPDMPMLSPNHPQRDWTSISSQFPIWKLDVRRPFCSAEEFVTYLIKFSEHFNLNIKTGTTVAKISREGDHFKLDTSDGIFQARTVYNATGFFGNPFIPKIPGMRNNPLVSHSHSYQSRNNYKGKRVIVIGGGNSAAEIAIDLVGHSQVYLITRDKLEFFSKTNNLCHIRGISESLLLELIRMELIRYISDSQIHKLDKHVLYYNDDHLETQAIICATGYRPVLSHLRSLKITTEAASKFPRVCETGESPNTPDMFFGGPLGYHGPGSLFIHGFIKNVAPTIKAIKSRLQQKN